jgi:hypothetical protein
MKDPIGYVTGQAAVMARILALSVEPVAATGTGLAGFRFTGRGVDVVAQVYPGGDWYAWSGGVAIDSVDGLHSLKLALADMTAVDQLRGRP